MREPYNVISLLILILVTVLVCSLLSCNHYPAQRKPYPVGTTGLYFNDITVDYAPPLTVVAFKFDDFNEYDGGYHYFYSVTDKNGKPFTHVIDYQLKK